MFGAQEGSDRKKQLAGARERSLAVALFFSPALAPFLFSLFLLPFVFFLQLLCTPFASSALHSPSPLVRIHSYSSRLLIASSRTLAPLVLLSRQILITPPSTHTLPTLPTLPPSRTPQAHLPATLSSKSRPLLNHSPRAPFILKQASRSPSSVFVVCIRSTQPSWQAAIVQSLYHTFWWFGAPPCIVYHW